MQALQEAAPAGERAAAAPAFGRLVLRGVDFAPALFCAPLAELTHSAFRRLLADFGGCGGHFTEMLSGRQLLHEDLRASPALKRDPRERRLVYQLMLRPEDPVERIVGRLSEIGPDGIDINLACYAPVIRQLEAGSGLFENLPALRRVLEAVRRSWAGPLTVKVRLGRSTVGAEDRFIERLRAFEELGVDALTLHTRYFEDKFKRRARHELFDWAGRLTRLPVIANGDLLGAHTIAQAPQHFGRVAGLMLGRMAIARPWTFAAWRGPVAVDYPGTWRRMADYIEADFPPEVAIKRLRLFTTYFARNFHFGHSLFVAVTHAQTIAAARDAADAFFAIAPATYDEPSFQGI